MSEDGLLLTPPSERRNTSLFLMTSFITDNCLPLIFNQLLLLHHSLTLFSPMLLLQSFQY